MVLPDSDGVSRVPPYSGSWTEETTFRLQDDCLLWSIFPDRSATLSLDNSDVQSYNPKKQASWFGLFPLRSPLLWEIDLSFSSCSYLDVSVHCVFLPLSYLFTRGCHRWRVPPFGHLRISACLQLPEAFRRLPRPSSASSA